VIGRARKIEVIFRGNPERDSSEPNIISEQGEDIYNNKSKEDLPRKFRVSCLSEISANEVEVYLAIL